jgi:hypothetical protein
MVWPFIGTIYGLAYLVYGLTWVRVEFLRSNPLLGIGTFVITIFGTAGLILYCFRYHDASVTTAWKILVIPYVLLNLLIACYKAWGNHRQIESAKTKSLSSAIGDAFLIELVCLYFNIKYAFFLH